jgi:glycosyltransferase involved in cell wall biosynthesis
VNVLLVNKFFHRAAGAETVFFDTLRLLEADGHNVVPFAMAHERNEPSSWSAYFARSRNYVSGPHLTRARDAVASIYSVDARSQLRRLLRVFEPDVAHLHNVYHQLTLSIVDELHAARVPTVLTLHDYKPVCPNYQLLTHDGRCMRCVKGPVVNAVIHRCIKGSVAASAVAAVEASLARVRRLYDKVDRFVAPSAFLRDVLVSGGFAASRIDVVPNPIETVRATSGSSSPRFVYVGRLAPEKGLSTLFDAIALVNTRGISIDVYGGGPLAETLQRRAETERLPVTLHGTVGADAVAAGLTSARALVLPSIWYENCPMSILEASAVGIPTIATNIGGIPELVQDSVTGLLVAPEDPVALAKSIDSLAADDRLARTLGAAARDGVRLRNSPASYRDAVLATYGAAGAPVTEPREAVAG